MVEDVHMQLFIAMIFCFMGMAWTAHVAMSYQVKLLAAHQHRISIAAAGGEVSAVSTPIGIDDKFYERFSMHRDFFIRITHKEVGEVMNADFDFARYIACSTDVILKDLTEFSIWTWVFVAFVTGIRTFISYLLMPSKYDAYGASNQAWECIFGTVVLMCITLVLYIWCFTGQGWLDKQAQRHKDGTEKTAHEDDETYPFKESKLDDTLPMRFMQAVSFCTAMTWARTVAGPRTYDGTWGGNKGDGLDGVELVAFYCAIIGLFVLQTLMQAQIVCDCSKILAFPPFFDRDNRKLAERVANVYADAVEYDFEQAATALGLPKAILKEKLMADYEKSHKDMNASAPGAAPPTMGTTAMEVEIEGDE